MNKQELFKRATMAMDNYNKSLESDDSTIIYFFEKKFDELYDIIEKNNLTEEFSNFCLA